MQKEHVAEFDYPPVKCGRSYRMIVLRKSISVEEGQIRLWDEIRYFFYITNIEEKTPAEVVFFCNERCNQENLIEQLKNGLNAMRMPVGDLVSNWAYMVMASLAWTLKAWFALLVRDRRQRDELLQDGVSEVSQRHHSYSNTDPNDGSSDCFSNSGIQSLDGDIASDL